MRVLHVVAAVDPAYTYGGPVTVAVQQCRLLRDAGHDAVLAAGWIGSGPAPEQVREVPARLFPVLTAIPGLRFSGLLSPRLLAWTARHAREFDVVHLHLARDLVPLTVGAVLRARGVPFVVQTHGMIEPDGRPVARLLDRILTRPVLRAARDRLLLIPSEGGALDTVAGRRGTDVVMPHAVEAPAEATRPPRGDVPEVLFLARLHPRKRVMVFAQAAERVLAAGVRARFAVVGPDDGDLPALRRFLADRPGLAADLVYEGPVEHTATSARFAAADLYVLPAVAEPLGMTLLEAGVRGVPSVCNDTCGLAPALTGAGAAVAVPDDDVATLAAAVGDLVTDRTRLDAMGAAAARYVHAEHDPQQVAAKLTARYVSAVATGKRR